MAIKVRMKPAHPGAVIREEILGPLGLGAAAAARVLGVRRATLSDLLNEKASLTPEMAMRLEKAFHRFGASAEQLLGFQAMLDLHEARAAAADLDVAEYKPAA